MDKFVTTSARSLPRWLHLNMPAKWIKMEVGQCWMCWNFFSWLLCLFRHGARGHEVLKLLCQWPTFIYHCYWLHHWDFIEQPVQIVRQVLFKYYLPWDKIYSLKYLSNPEIYLEVPLITQQPHPQGTLFAIKKKFISPSLLFFHFICSIHHRTWNSLFLSRCQRALNKTVKSPVHKVWLPKSET